MSSQFTDASVPASARWGLGVAIPAVAITWALAPFAMFASHLPDPIASHFDASGTPDGSMGLAMFATITLGLVAVGAVMCAFTAFRSRVLPSGSATIVGFVGAFGALLGATMLAITAISQRDIAGWTDASSGWWMIVAAFVVPLAGGALGARLGAKLDPEPTRTIGDAEVPVLQLGDGERVVWTATERSPVMFALGVGLIVLGVVLCFVGPLVAGLITITSGIPAFALSTLAVRVDHRGLHVNYRWLPWPRTHVTIERIDEVSVIDVRPMEWGGWGYRGALRLTGRAAIVHRAGPGIRLDLRDDAVLVVTLNDATTAAGLLNALAQRYAALAV